MRIRQTLPRALAVAGLVMAAAGCGDQVGVGTAASSASATSPSASATSPSAPAASTSASARTPSASAESSPPPEAVVLWPAPPDPLERTVAAGLQPEPQEYMTNHVHAHLDVFVDGKPISIPAGIGINVDDPDVRRFDEPDGSVAYGGITECAKPCISPLHTHDETGIIHTESATPEPHTLGEFFIEWDVLLSDSCVGEYCKPKEIAVYVNGEAYSEDPRAIELTDRKVIAIVIGTPPAQIPKTADFSRA